MEIKKMPNIKQRNVGFDVARGIAVFLMIFQHFYLLILGGRVNNEWLSFSFFLLGTFLVAPVFLFLMGVNVITSRHNKPKQLFKKGLFLIILGYLLSFLRFFLPLVIADNFGLIANFEDIIYKFEPIYYLLEVDIFQVAGLSLWVIAFLRWRKTSIKYYLFFALLLSLLSPLFWMITFRSQTITLLTDPLWGKSSYVVFPFFSWAVYSLVGVYFGKKILENKNKIEFYQKCFNKSVIFLIPGLLLFLIDFLFFDYSYARHGFGYNFLFIVIIIIWLSWLNLRSYKIPSKVTNTLTFFSKNVSYIYFIQWVIIGWLAVFINLNIFN